LRARGAIVGVATGNLRDGARMKLASAGLDGTFDLDLGAFGCEAEPRAEVVRLAAKRCAWGNEGTNLVVVGDTEHDVRAGRALGARVVGVATDSHARAELAAAGADVIVETCDDDLVEAVLQSPTS
jgi:phosphoglycolate phosphatase-like HAD superfamily hydrolase